MVIVFVLKARITGAVDALLVRQVYRCAVRENQAGKDNAQAFIAPAAPRTGRANKARSLRDQKVLAC